MALSIAQLMSLQSSLLSACEQPYKSGGPSRNAACVSFARAANRSCVKSGEHSRESSEFVAALWPGLGRFDLSLVPGLGDHGQQGRLQLRKGVAYAWHRWPLAKQPLADRESRSFAWPVQEPTVQAGAVMLLG